MLDIDPKLKLTYELYSRYLKFIKTSSYDEAYKEIEILIEDFFNSDIKQFIDIAKSIFHWKEYILNSFIKVESIDCLNKRRLSNGPIEEINSINENINVNGNGYTNFYRFRNRVIYSINNNVPLKMK